MPRISRKVLSLLVIFLLAGAGCSKEEPETKAEKKKAAAPVSVNFQPGEARGVSANDRPEAGPRANEEAAKVIQLLNTFYSIAFVQSDKWQDGKHPELAALFTAEAQGPLQANLGALALEDLASKLRSVKPKTQQAPRMSFMVEEDLSTPVGAVTVLFEGEGSARTKSDGPVAIVHNATFFLVKEGESYKISAYQTELKADTATKSAAFGSPPEEQL